MRRFAITLGILYFTFLPSTVDAGSCRHSHCKCQTKCCTSNRTEPCEGASACEDREACAAAVGGAYDAFAGPNGSIYGVNNYTGQLYKLENGSWIEAAPAMP